VQSITEYVGSKSQAPGGETEILYVHRLKRDWVMEMPPKSAMVEANLKTKWEAWGSQATSDLQLHPAEPAGNQSPCFTSIPPPSHPPWLSCLLLSPVPSPPPLSTRLESMMPSGRRTEMSPVNHGAVSVICIASVVLGKSWDCPPHICAHSSPPWQKGLP